MEKSFLELFLGELSIHWYLALFFFGFLGMFLNWYIRTKRGVKTSMRSPEFFSLKFWVRDNLLSVIVSAMGTVGVLFIFFRLFDNFFVGLGEITVGSGFFIGFFFDRFIKKLEDLKPPAFKE